jgi:hypothetical protein
MFFWGIYEMGFPEDAHAIGSRGSEFPFEAFLLPSLNFSFFIKINNIFKTKKGEMIMSTKKSMWVLFAILVISAWVLGSANQAGAETMNYKVYNWVIKTERVPVSDVQEHTVGFEVRKGFSVFENGEVATHTVVSTTDLINMSGPFTMYVTINFQDGSTIVYKSQGVRGGPSSGWTSEILKGTGRFEGIKGTQSGKVKYLPFETGEAGPKAVGEGTITYTLPSK